MAKKQPRTAMVVLGEDNVWRAAGLGFVGDNEKPDDYWALPTMFGTVEVGDLTMSRAVRVDTTGRCGWIAA